MMDVEIKRQVVHASGIFTILLIQFFGRSLAAILVLSMVTILWMAAYYRLNKKKINPAIIPKELEKLESIIEKEFERPKEFPLRGAITFYLGAFLAIILFQPNAAIPAIIVLAMSDSFSTLIGKFYGKHKLFINKNKSWEGSTAFFIPALVVLLFFVDPARALLVSLIATFVEMLPRLDDNITIPIAVGFLLSFA